MLKKTQELVIVKDEDAIPEVENENEDESNPVSGSLSARSKDMSIGISGDESSLSKSPRKRGSVILSIQDMRKQKRMLELKTLLIQVRHNLFCYTASSAILLALLYY